MSNVLFIRHHLEDNPGLIGGAFRTRGFSCDLVMMDESTPTPSLDGYDVLVILGSKESVYDHEVEAAWFGRELALMGDAARRNVPIVGIVLAPRRSVASTVGVFSCRTRPRSVGMRSRRTMTRELFRVRGLSSTTTAAYFLPRRNCGQRHRVRSRRFASGRRTWVSNSTPRSTSRQLRDWFEADLVEHPREFASREELLAQTARETPDRPRFVRSDLVDVFLAHIADMIDRFF